jgi:hypothetical protein
MRLPEFTAEASLYKMDENYVGASAASTELGRVKAQFDYSSFGPEYWAGLATQHDRCQPPCELDSFNICRCPIALVNTGGPKLPTGITAR